MLDNGADANASDNEGMTPLWNEINSGNGKFMCEVIRFLVEEGRADVNAVFQGRSVLHAAITANAAVRSTSRLPIVKYLVEKGAEVNAKDGEGIGLVGVASKSFSSCKNKMIEILKEAGAKE